MLGLVQDQPMSAAGEEKGMTRYFTVDKSDIFRNEVHNK